MSTKLYTVRPDSDVTAAEQLMREKQVRRIPVVDGGGRPVGMVSIHDLAQRVGNGKSEVPAREVAETLRDLSKPRSRGRAASLAATG